MDDDDRRINETIARACGWVEGEYDGGFAGPNCYGWHHPRSGRDIGLPDYIADPARLPEMWALCREKYRVCSIVYPDGFADVEVWNGYGVLKGYWNGPLGFQDAFARALAAALESGEGG